MAGGGPARQRARYSGDLTSRRDSTAATRFFRKLLTGLQDVSRVLVTNKLASYHTARRRVLRSVEHRQSKYLNNRAKNGQELPPAHPGARTSNEEVHLSRARQRFLSAFSSISPHFRPGRHQLSAGVYRREMANRFATWTEVTGTATAAA